MWNIAVDWTSPATFTQDLINPLQCREYHQVVTLLDCIFYIYLGITVVRAALPDKIFFFLEKTSHTMNSIQSHKKTPTKTNKNPDTQTLNLFFFLHTRTQTVPQRLTYFFLHKPKAWRQLIFHWMIIHINQSPLLLSRTVRTNMRTHSHSHTGTSMLLWLMCNPLWWDNTTEITTLRLRTHTLTC